MSISADVPARKPGRPSRHPVAIKYYESPALAALLEQEADRRGMTLSQLLRIVNRAGIQALDMAAA